MFINIQHKVPVVAFHIKALHLRFYDLIICKPSDDFDHVWYDKRYWFKIWRSTIPTPVQYLKVKVTDLEFLC